MTYTLVYQYSQDSHRKTEANMRIIARDWYKFINQDERRVIIDSFFVEDKPNSFGHLLRYAQLSSLLDSQILVLI